MDLRNPQKWWQMTRFLALAGSGLAVLVTVAMLAVERWLGSRSMLAIPAGEFVAVFILPAALIVFVFLAADLQDRIDRHCEMSGGK